MFKFPKDKNSGKDRKRLRAATSGKRVHPHVLRYTTAMHLIQNNVSIIDVSHVLGHESIATTSRYLKADLESKRRALEKIDKPSSVRKPLISLENDEDLIKWLEKH
jgi:integrase